MPPSAPSADGSDAFPELAAAARAVCDAVAEGLARRAWDHPPMRSAVIEYAHRARELDVPPQRFVAALKRLVREQVVPDASPWLVDTLTSRVVLWGIDAYFSVRE